MARWSFKKFSSGLVSLSALALLASCGGGGGDGNGGGSPGFSITLSPDSLTIAPGRSGQTLLTIAPYGGFAGTVSISLEGREGITVSPQSVVVFGNSPVQQGLTIRVDSSVEEGEYDVVLRTASASVTTIRTLRLIVQRGGGTPDFALRLDPSSLRLSPGSNGQTTLTVTPLNGFTGTIILTLLNAPAGVSLSPTSVNVPGASPVQQTLTISVAAGVSARQYTMTLQGSSGGITRAVTLDLTVTTTNAFTVNTTADSVDIAPGDGVCADANGNCSVRAAVMEANARRSGVTITIPAGTYQLTLPPTSNDEHGGDLDLKANMTIRGAGQEQTILVSAQPDRVVQVAAAVQVTIESLTMRGGTANAGGGIYSEGNLSLRNCKVTDSGGGGIYNDRNGNMTMDDCTVEQTSGTGVTNRGNLTMRNCVVTSSTSSGLSNDGGRLEALRCTFSANRGQGISNWNSGTVTLTDCILGTNGDDGLENTQSGTVSLAGCTLTANTYSGVSNDGVLTAVNCTFSGNRTGVGNWGIARLSFCTVFGNRGDSSAGGIWAGSPVELRGVIVAGNSPNQCRGTIISRGYNLISDTAQIEWRPAPDPTDVLNVDPVLQPLAYNGGPTPTHMPAEGSPALNKVPPAECTDVEGRPISKDQRGVTRPQGGAGDIGAVERS